ncbi:MAG: hypothetical protein HUJ51_04020 [Eggerthellaceae bacterium]|nr:hypothetical protein [Eggerthellaceae bacterium]
MGINITLNSKAVKTQIEPDMVLYNFLRAQNCYRVKWGCKTSNCGLYTVFFYDMLILSCSYLGANADGHEITILDGL